MSYLRRRSAGVSPPADDIRAARAAAGLTQTAAAQSVHCTLRAWQSWEGAERRMHPAVWALFLQVHRLRSVPDVDAAAQ